MLRPDPQIQRLILGIVGSLVFHATLWAGLPSGKGGPLGEGGRGAALSVELRVAPRSIEALPAAEPLAAHSPRRNESSPKLAAAIAGHAAPIARKVEPRIAQGVALSSPTTAAPTLEQATSSDATPAPEVGADLVVTAASETSALVEDRNAHAEIVSSAREAARGTHYFASHEVDTRAAPQGAIHTDTPEGSEDYAGYLVLRLLISERGDVDQVDVLISEPEGVFDVAAKASFGRASFYPAMRDGFPVKSQMVVELKIEPDFGALLSQSANARQLLDRPRKEDRPRKD